MVQIKWTLQAKDDLKTIAEYIKLDSTRCAKLQVIKNELPRGSSFNNTNIRRLNNEQNIKV